MYQRVKIPVISNNGLTKEKYEFEVKGTHLSYVCYMKYERDRETDIWPDEWPDAISLEEWLKDYDPDWEPAYEGDEPDDYRKYHNSLNPCMNKTSDGRCKGGGMSGYRLHCVHPLPPAVPALARKMLFGLLTVDGE